MKLNLYPHNCYKCSHLNREKLECSNLKNCDWLRTNQTSEIGSLSMHPFLATKIKSVNGTKILLKRMCLNDCIEMAVGTSMHENPCNTCILIKGGFNERL